ncbi:FSH1-domain-containing protein [Aaosphaeria arxii CBS 175.79]|uniref:FSH1-domain-containing protein n=1 Tax=Aaosphaeria arxii CBS 175.79 TaxID=1450172 RepID=A0A6A5YCJ0_9PLEO|nr:FSH1-domain-containing protein [Aaosphaeria arxii CBS 175.79]KAF2022334.1 FSH1-domain-containing protein [Aaosphaeria arxii CBS 175.79]
MATTDAPPPTRPIKLLMIHGYTQSGPLFYAKTRALEKILIKSFPAGVSLHYPTGPIRLSPADEPFLATRDGGETPEDEIDAWAWWKKKGQGDQYVYEGLDRGFAQLATALKEEGPFDGVIGFSQGACATGLLASALEPGRKEVFEKLQKEGGIEFPSSLLDASGETIHPPFKFAVSYSGFAPVGVDAYRAFFEPKIKTPLLHFIGCLDTVVEEKRSLAYIDTCEQPATLYHPGGHILASQKIHVTALIRYIYEQLYKSENPDKATQEESVEDMDVPF